MEDNKQKKIMTNEELSKQIAEKHVFTVNDTCYFTFSDIVEACLETAKLKGQRFKEYLEKKKADLIQQRDKYNRIAEYGPKNYLSAQIIIIDEFIDTLFKE